MASLALSHAAGDRFLRARFVATLFAGSFLLFLVQPMIARMALPRLGGAPAVWNSAMLVYQALLLAGYAYAHFLGRLAPRRQAIVHLGLLALAALTLPISLLAGTPSPSANIFLWVPWLLLTSIGPLFLVVSAQAPLMQRWFAVSGGGDPYPLYAASNFGSFLGLLAYPLAMEPLVPVAGQSLLWSVGYAILFLFVAACAFTLPRAAAPDEVRPAGEAPTRRDIVRWIALAAIPSGLMLSTTLHITTDIVAMPLLWVVPLGLYLLSFSVAFATDRRMATLCTRLAPFALIAAAASLLAVQYPRLAAVVPLVALFLVSAGIHSRLFELRPDPSRLTGFYLATSLGGALGGLFCALIAPLMFDWTYEHPLLLGAAGIALAGTQPIAAIRGLWSTGEGSRRLARWLAVALCLLSLSGIFLYANGEHPRLALIAPLIIASIAVVALGHRLLFGLALIALTLSLGGWEKIALSTGGHTSRSFFGIYTVRDIGTEARMLVHGTTVHGVELRGTPQRERQATTYYVANSGVGLAMRAAPALSPNARIGVVGLGAGTLGCYGVAGQQWRFYEIDPMVASIARDPARFHFLSDCQPTAPIEIGDARLTLAREPAGSADLLVVDAFSSDSVPMHLLTAQAYDVYRRHLAPNGLLLVHITNRFLDLRPVVAAAAANGWTARIREFGPTVAEKRDAAAASTWIALSPSSATIGKLEQLNGPGAWRPLQPTKGFAAWTDDHASILPIIKWKG